jgi:hypothetical protein
MKNLLLIVVVALTLVSCAKENEPELSNDKWNGYSRYLKAGEQVHTLWAGKHLNIGTVTYGIDDSANFYVAYDCSSSGWKISETHMYAGDKANLPLNKPGAPKIGRFPYSGNHNPNVDKFIYSIPLSSLPPCDEPGFVVASHCLAYGPSGQKETAWAEGEYTFSDKGWGWYDVFFYNQEENPFTVLYCICMAHDSLRLYHLDITKNSIELTYVEYVGNSAGSYDAAAYDTENGLFYFVKTESRELWINFLEEEENSFFSGVLQGSALSATFHNENFYYVDSVDNTIRGVNFTDNWNIFQDIILDTIATSISVNDIAMNPEGSKLFISGELTSGEGKLLYWEPSTGNLYDSSTEVSKEAQIAFGSDGLLYAVSNLFSEGGIYEIQVIDIESDTLTVIDEEIIYIEDPFSDLAKGPMY